MVKIFFFYDSRREFIYKKLRSKLKKNRHKKDFFTNPEKYLIYDKSKYSAEYIRQLKYILKKKYKQ